MIPIITLGHGMRPAPRKCGGSRPGPQHGTSKLSAEGREQLMASRGTMTAKQAAYEFGIHYTTVNRAWAGKAWR